jgi:hypothetical protein
MTTDRVETPKELADRVGLSEYQIKQLIRTGELEHVPVCGRKFIPSGAWPRYLEANTKGGKSWQDETKEPSCATSKIAEPSISLGQSTVAAASAALARQTAKRLKSSSRTGSKDEASEAAPVIHLRCSSRMR